MGNKQEFIDFCRKLELEQKKGRKKCVLSYMVFKWVLRSIPEGSRILELGSGKSSGAFSLLYKVDSIEHDQKYLNKNRKVNYIHAPIKEYEKYFWYDTKAIKEKLADYYDLIIVDGPTNRTGREGFAVNYSLFKDYGCPIIIDETDRKVEKEMLGCFLSSGFEKICDEEKHVIIKPPKKSRPLNKKCVEKLLENKAVVVLKVNEVLPALEKKRNFDLCIVYCGKSVQTEQTLKKISDYYLSDRQNAWASQKVFDRIPKLKKYKSCVILDNSQELSSEELEECFKKLN